MHKKDLDRKMPAGCPSFNKLLKKITKIILKAVYDIKKTRNRYQTCKSVTKSVIKHFPKNNIHVHKHRINPKENNMLIWSKY